MDIHSHVIDVIDLFIVDSCQCWLSIKKWVHDDVLIGQTFIVPPRLLVRRNFCIGPAVSPSWRLLPRPFYLDP
jgi:hypothetical protein